MPLVGWTIPDRTSGLVKWVETHYPAPCSTCGVRALADYLSARLEAAEVVNATGLAQQLEHVLRIYGEVLKRRDVAIPLLVLDSIGEKPLRPLFNRR